MGLIDWFERTYMGENADNADSPTPIYPTNPYLRARQAGPFDKQVVPTPAEVAADERQKAVAGAAVPKAITQIPDIAGVLHSAATYPFGEGETWSKERLARTMFPEGEFDKAATEAQAAKARGASEREIDEIVSSHKHGYRRASDVVNNIIDDYFGAPRDPEKTLGERVGTGMVQGMMPIPNPIKPIVPRVIADIANPGHNPGSALSAGINVGAAAAIPIGIDAALKGAREEPENEVDAAEMSGAAAMQIDPKVAMWSILGGVAMAKPRSARMIADEAVLAAKTAVDDVAKASSRVVKGGAQEVPGKRSIKEKVAHGFDEQAAIKKAIADATGNSVEATRTLREINVDWRANKDEKFNHWDTVGHLEGMKGPTFSGKMIRDLDAQYARDGMAGDANLYYTARIVQDETRYYARQLAADLTRKSSAYTKAVDGENWKQANSLYDEIGQINKKIENLNNDVKEARLGLQDIDAKQLDDIVRAGDANPAFAPLRTMASKVWDDSMEYAYNNGALSRAMTDRLKEINPHSPPNVVDPHAGATGFFKRGMSKIDSKINRNEDPFGDDPKYMQAWLPYKVRNFETDTPINTPVGFADSINLHMKRLINHVSHERVNKNVIDSVLAGKDHAKVINLHDFGRGKTEFTVPEIRQMLAKNQNLEFEHYIPYRVGDKVRFYSFNDKSVHQELSMNPLTSIPVAREMSRFFRFWATREGNPAFAKVAMMYDTATIQQTRPPGSVYGLDALTNAVSLGKSPAWLQAATRVFPGWADPTPQLANYGFALNTFYNDNKLMIADKIARDLVKDEGFFANLAVIPGGREILQRTSNTMLKSFNDSFFGMLTHNHVTSVTAMEHNLRNIREVDKLITARMPREVQIAGAPAVFAWNQYRAAINAVNSAARVGYAYQNAWAKAIQSGKFPTRANMKSIASIDLADIITDARTLAADIAVQPGSKGLQAVASAMPYTNIILRTSGALWQRFKEDKVFQGMVWGGAVAPSLYTAYHMSNSGPDAYKYWWHDTPAHKRESTVLYPSPSLWLDWQQGKTRPFNINDYLQLTILPELRPLATSVVHGVRSLGMLGKRIYGGNFFPAAQMDPMAPNSFMEVMSTIGESFGQAFGLMTPPVLAGPLASSGQRMNLDIAKMAEGKFTEPLNTGNADTRIGGATINPGSDVNKTFANIIGQMMGVGATRLVEAYDTGMQRFDKSQKRGEDVLDSIIKGVTGAGEEFAQRSNPLTQKAGIPLILNAEERLYRFTPISQKNMEMRSAFKAVNDFRGGLNKPVGIPALDQIGNAMRGFSRNNGEYKRLGKTFIQLTEELATNESRRELTYTQRAQERTRLLKRVNAENHTQSTLLTKYEAQIAASPMGEQYKQMYGKPFTLKEFEYKLREAKRKSKAAP